MRITTEDLGDRQVLLTIEVDEERVETALRGVARRVSRDYRIPGFRRGRAPYNIVLRRFGREALLQEAMEDLAQEAFEAALETENLEPYDVGSLEDVQLDPLVFKLRVPLMPVVDLGDYRELRVAPPVVTVDEEKVDAELERLRQANAVLEPAGDRPAEMGDWVSLDVNGDLGDEALVREEAYSMVLDAEDKEFEVGFVEQIVGIKTDEEKQFTLTLGDDWGETRSGQEATFTVTLREARSRMLPDLDDDLARTVGDFDTIEELRQSIHDEFEEEAQRAADTQYVEEVIEALLACASVEYPPDVVEDRVDDIAESLEQRLEPQGISLEDYYKLTGQTEEQFRESLRSQADASVQRGLVLSELANLENLDVEGDEVEARIAAMSTRWGEQAGDVREMLSEPDSMRSIASSVLADKAVQRLVAIAKGEAPPLEEVDQETEEEQEPTAAGAETPSAEPAEAAVEEEPAEEFEPAQAEVDETPVEQLETPQAEMEETPAEEPETAQTEPEETPVVEADSSSEAG